MTSILARPEEDYVDDVVMHHQSAGYDITGDLVYFPVNHNQLRDLLGKVLTHLDMMAVPDRAHRAAKALLVAEVWRWWDRVYDNATTSAQGCIAPIVCAGDRLKDGDEQRPHSNRWGWASEDAYLASLK